MGRGCYAFLKKKANLVAWGNSKNNDGKRGVASRGSIWLIFVCSWMSSRRAVDKPNLSCKLVRVIPETDNQHRLKLGVCVHYLHLQLP